MTEPLQDSPGIRLLEAFKHLKRHTADFRPAGSLRPSEFFTLHALAHSLRRQGHGEHTTAPLGFTMTALGRTTRRSTPAVSQIVRSLEEKGLVERVMAHQDRRNVYVRPTASGEKLVDESGQSFFSFLDEVADEMGKENVEELLNLLGKLDVALTEVKKRHPDFS